MFECIYYNDEQEEINLQIWEVFTMTHKSLMAAIKENQDQYSILRKKYNNASPTEQVILIDMMTQLTKEFKELLAQFTNKI